MTQIDTSKPILATGATGFVAGWLIKKLLEQGLTVHGTVRNPDNEQKLAHLKEIESSTSGNIRFFKADLLDEGSFAEAMEGCELVYHTASPFTTSVNDPQKQLIEPALKGTENVLFQANETSSVKRVVLTSSCAAMYTDATEIQHTPNGELTEEVWNTTSSLEYQPYSYSKVLAEKRAWEINQSQSQWDLVVINPCLVLGPALNASSITSESYNILKQMGDGTMKLGAPRMGIGLVDVREVAEAHVKAGFTPEAHGRYITCAHNTNILEIAKTLLPKYGDDYPIPIKPLPKWLLMLIGPMINKGLTRRTIKNNIDIEWKADNSKIRKELNIKFRPIQETMEDSFQVLIDHKII